MASSDDQLNETQKTAAHTLCTAVSVLESISAEQSRLFDESLPAVWSASSFVEHKLQVYAEQFLVTVQSQRLFRAYEQGEIHQRLHSELAVQNEKELMQAMRIFRNTEMLRVIWRDLAGWATLTETMSELSELADACVDVALQHVYRWQSAIYGEPCSTGGKVQQLVVLGLGKLGGHELNLSSDIDLIFTYPEEGESNGDKKIDNQAFFQKVGQQLISILSKLTVDGFVFRVDMRLRPFGDGPIVCSFDAMEDYYQIHGREWERYALIKARVIAGDKTQGAVLLKRLHPFVYRRYVDYSAFASIREMKSMIQKEVLRKNIEHNIKIGAGGIREIEFIGQVFQLIRGGREARLQSRSILKVLAALQAMNVLPEYVVKQLTQAYDFLRRTEHRLQAWRDEQTHVLPQEEAGQLRLANSMGFDSWSGFYQKLLQHRTHVHEHFDQVFVAPQSDTPSEDTTSVTPLWLGEIEDDEAQEILNNAGFANEAEVWRRIKTLRQSRAYRNLSARGNHRMEQLMPLLLSVCQARAQPDLAFLRCVEVIEAIMQRSVYLVLLIENPVALSQFVRLCESSPWITRYLSQHPLLLDDLLDVANLLNPPMQAALNQELTRRMQEVAGDEERSLDVLRQFKHSHFLKVAAADIFDAIPLMQVSNHLSWIAEVVLEHTLNLAWQHLITKHGRPVCTHAGAVCDSGFAVIAYGKLGGFELGYGSDLDVVFLHSGESESLETTGAKPIPLGVFFARLAQRMMHILGAMTPSGVLFEVDTRLRPDGAAGMLVSSLKSFAAYQQNKAWTWEHQALVRARVVAGDPAIAEQFEQIRAEILSQPRDVKELRLAVIDMRHKMLETMDKAKADQFDLKHSQGGIVDIEFMVQYGVLAFSHEHAELLRWTDNIRLLEVLANTAVMKKQDAAFLNEAYQSYRNRLHRIKLQESSAIVPAHEFEQQRAGVLRIWASWLLGKN